MKEDISVTDRRLSRFSFFKGNEDVIAQDGASALDWDDAARIVREHVTQAMNARHISFLLGSGCSSIISGDKQLGIPTMIPLAKEFLSIGSDQQESFVQVSERQSLIDDLGLELSSPEYSSNLERLIELLFGIIFVDEKCRNARLSEAARTARSVAEKAIRFIMDKCLVGPFSAGDDSVIDLYESFYRKLVFRDRALPQPWVFTTNYDLFNERAMDHIGVPYCNGFSGTVERRFNPATFRYTLAEQLDISSRKWTAVDGFVYLCKLHGSVGWIYEDKGLFPIREIQQPQGNDAARVMIYPTPSKQSISFGSPYADLFREFQRQLVQDQSVLFVIGYSFGDEHINNIIFQALTVPTFRLIAFLDPGQSGIPERLRQLGDPRIWLIGGNGPTSACKAHYFSTVVDQFLPESPGDKIDSSIERVMCRFLSPKKCQFDTTANEEI